MAEDVSIKAEHYMVSRVIYRPAEFPEVVAAGISANHFHDEEHGAIWDWILKHWERHGQVPGREALLLENPRYTLAKVPEPLSYYIDLLNRAHARNEVHSMLLDATKLAGEEDIAGTRKLLADRLMWLEQDTYVTSDENLNDTWAERIEEYQRIADLGDQLIGIPTGFKTFDLITGGFQPEQFVVLIGPQKAGKSSVMLRSAWAANQAGKKVLFIGFEMTNREQAARFDGMRGGFNYMKLLLGKMGPRERAALEEAGKEYQNLPEMLFVHDLSAATTLTSISAKIQEHKPDIVFVDGVYMMDSEVEGAESMDTRALTKISRGLKRMAQVRKIPIIISTQALDWKWNAKKGLTAGATGYTSAFGQDCDFMFGVEPPEDEDDNIAKMRLIIGRTAPKKMIYIEFDWDRGSIEERESWTDDLDDYDDDGDGYARSA